MENLFANFARFAGMSGKDLEELLGKDPEALAIAEEAYQPIHSWAPRPNKPEEFDEQSSFVSRNYHFDGRKYVYDTERPIRFSCCLGGTGSGKTSAGGFKTAHHLLEIPAPRHGCPFWVIGETFELVCSVCWDEKLSKFIPKETIEHIDWYKSARNWPFAVQLKNGWAIEFKSYAQGRRHMQARSIGGYWFNEEVPIKIVEEVQGRCRDYDSPGWADFTPIEVVSPEWPEAYDNPPEGWEFFHLNTELNTALAPGWAQRYLSTIPADMRDTRRIGVFASYRGQVFKEWNKKLHVIEPFEIPDDWHKIRGMDFGFNNPFCCLWVARDHDGRYYVYDEHFAAERTIAWHAEQIKNRPWPENHPCIGTTWSDHDAQVRKELQVHGINTTPAKKAVHAGIELVRSMLMVHKDGKPRLYVFNHCENLIREMRAYHWPETVGSGTMEKNAGELPVPFDDHAVDACRYALASEEWSGVEFQKPIEKQKRVWQRQAVGFFG